MRRLLLAVAVCAGFAVVPARAAAPGAAPLDFVSTDGTVYAVERHGDDLYIGGNFDHVQTRLDGAIGLDATGARTSPEFPRVEGGAVAAIVSDGAGGWFLGGDFTRVAGTPVARLAHVDAGGALDPAFNALTTLPVTALLRLGSSLYVATGNILSPGRVEKLNATTGAVDTFFTAQLDGNPLAMATDGASLYVGGRFLSVGSDGAAPRLARLNLATGAVDHAFNPAPDGEVRAIALGGGAVYAGGTFGTIDGQSGTPRLAKLDAANGTADTAFAAAPDQPVDALWHDGAHLFAGGEFSTIHAQSATPRLAKLDPATGAADTAFAPAPDQPVRALWHDGTKLYAGGTFGAVGGHAGSLLVARLDPVSGAVDLAFHPDFGGTVSTLTGGAGGTVVAGGALGRSYALRNVAHVDLATGTIDAGFHPDPTDEVSALLYDGTDLYIGGSFTTIGAQTATPRLARVNAVTGAVDTTFHPPAVAGAGTIVLGIHRAGSDLVLNGAPALLAKIGASGASDPDFQGQVDDLVNTVAVAATSVYIGGQFQTVDNQFATPWLAKLDASTGAVDLGFAPAPDADVRQLVHDGTSLDASGAFGSIGGQASIGHLVKLSPASGLADAAFHPKPGSTPFALWREGSWLYAGGGFTSIGSQTGTPRLARVDAISGAVDTTYNPTPDGTVRALWATSTSVFAGGAFADVDGIAHQGFVLVGPPRPRATAAPAITGTPQPGSMLTCSDGTWSDATLPFARRWLADGAAVAGQTGTTFAVQASDVGKHLACEVTARNGTGPGVALSTAVTVVAGATATPTPTPTPIASPQPTPTPTPVGTTPDTAAPALSAVSLTRRRFRAKRGTTFRFTVSERATVTIRITRHKPRSVRGTLKRNVAKGPQRVAFSGRFGGKALAPGAYDVRVRATDAAGNRSRAVTLHFTILR